MSVCVPDSIDARRIVAELPERAELASTISGWCSGVQGACLYALAREAAPYGRVVEVGSWQGRSTCWIGWGVLDAGGRRGVTAVDGFSDPTHGDGGRSEYRDPEDYSVLPKFLANVERAGLSEVVTPLVGWSPEVAELYDGEPIAMLYVDGLHEYEAVMADVAAWSRWLLPGGVVCFDDVREKFGGVVRAVRELEERGLAVKLGRAPIPKGFEWFRWLG